LIFILAPDPSLARVYYARNGGGTYRYGSCARLIGGVSAFVESEPLLFRELAVYGSRFDRVEIVSVRKFFRFFDLDGASRALLLIACAKRKTMQRPSLFDKISFVQSSCHGKKADKQFMNAVHMISCSIK
jgi:hypothetical protein